MKNRNRVEVLKNRGIRWTTTIHCTLEEAKNYNLDDMKTSYAWDDEYKYLFVSNMFEQKIYRQKRLPHMSKAEAEEKLGCIIEG